MQEAAIVPPNGREIATAFERCGGAKTYPQIFAAGGKAPRQLARGSVQGQSVGFQMTAYTSLSS
jgi:hypothetical protein